MHPRPSLFLSLVVPSVLLAGSAVAASRGLSVSTSAVPLTVPSTSPAAPAACAGEAVTPAGLVFGDVDGDGLEDAFVLGAEGQAHLLMNFGAGRFEDITQASNLAELGGASCALFADFDGDGRLDLFTGSSEERLWKNLGNATFEPMPSGIDHDLVDLAAQAVDHDQDGRLDLQIHTEAGDLVYRNLGEGRFERVELPLGVLTQAPAHVGWIAPKSVDATDPLATPDAGTPAERRLGRWAQGRAVGGFASTTTSGSALAGFTGPALPFLSTCQPGVRDANGGACIGASSVPVLGKLYPLSSNLFVDSTNGYVGIGTTTPNRPLTIQDGGLRVDLPLLGGSPDGSHIDLGTPGGSPGLVLVKGDGSGGVGQRWDMAVSPDNSFRISDSTVVAQRLTINSAGFVGVGTSTPSQKLTIQDGNLEVDLPTLGGSPDGSKIYLGTPGGTPGVIMVRGDGSGGVGQRWDMAVSPDNSLRFSDSTGVSAERLTINSAGLVSVKQSLEIRGGADIVERFSSSCGLLEPGTVVAIDPENPGQLSCSFDAYDTKVAGVVSGAGGVKPGLCLTQDGHLDGETPVAMTGRVYVKCSTENGAIRPGDRLTTAALAGHAMKVTDEQRSVGAVIGKAMSALDEGTGLVLVLVNLQ